MSTCRSGRISSDKTLAAAHSHTSNGSAILALLLLIGDLAMTIHSKSTPQSAALLVSRVTALVALVLVVPHPNYAVEYIQGIDVYHGDGEVDWKTLKKNVIQFAFVKATEGTNYVDKRFDANMKGATAAGVLIGPYHFCRIDNNKDGEKFASYDGSPFTPGTDRYEDAVAEAKAFLKVILPYYRSGKYLPPVADVEGLPKFGDAKLEKMFISNWMQVFSDEIKNEMGIRPIIYTSKSGAKTRYTSEFAAEHELWLAYWKKSGHGLTPHSGRRTRLEAMAILAMVSHGQRRRRSRQRQKTRLRQRRFWRHSKATRSAIDSSGPLASRRNRRRIKKCG